MAKTSNTGNQLADKNNKSEGREDMRAGRRSPYTRINRESNRPKIPEIDRIATKAWFNHLKMVTHSRNTAEVALRCGHDNSSRSYPKYARGDITPSMGTLAKVDVNLKTMKLSPASQVFNLGPEGVPLWDALSGNYEALWSIIDHAFPAIPKVRYAKNAHEKRVDAYLSMVFANNSYLPLIEAHKSNPQSDRQPNFIDTLYAMEKAGSRLEVEPEIYGIEQLIEDEERQIKLILDFEEQRRILMGEKLNEARQNSYLDAMKIEQQESERYFRIHEEISRRQRYIGEVLQPVLDEGKPHHATVRSLIRRAMKEKFRQKPLLSFGFPQLAGTIALWRISMLAADSVDKMDYVINGLMEHAIPDMLKPYGVDEGVIRELKKLRTIYHRWTRA